MPIPFRCTNCGRTGRFPDSFSGDEIQCPACETIMPVAEAIQAARKGTAKKPAPVPVDDEDDASERSSSPIVLIAGGVAAVAFLVVGGVATVLMSGGSTPKPGPAPQPQPQPVATAAPEPSPTPQPAPLPAVKPALNPVPTTIASAPPVAVVPAGNTSPTVAGPGLATPSPTPTPTVTPAVARADSSPAEVVQRIKDATVFVKVRAGRLSGSGSGFVIQTNGDSALIATNHHVVNPHIERDEDDGDPRLASIKPVVTVVFRSGRGQAVEQSLPAQVIAQEREGNRDLAILKVQGVKEIPRPIDLADKVEAIETMPVLIYGFPYGNIDRMLNPSAAGNPAVTINKGSVSSLRMDAANHINYVQIDGSINPGNSGGPVVDEKGRLIGVSVAQISNTTIGFAIPPAELNRMLGGKIGRLSMALQKEQGGIANLQVQAKVIDPLNRIKGVEFLYAPEGSRPEPTPNPDGTWAPINGAERVSLNLAGPLAMGPFQTAVAGLPGRKLLIQASYRDSDGKVIYTIPVKYTIPARPAAMAAVGAVPSEAKRVGATFAALGDLVDPTKNCKLTRDEKAMTIEVPPGVHLLSDDLDIKNAPMTLADVEGDFIAQVKLGGALIPGTEPPKYKGKTLPFIFQGEGLILWQDKNNYLRLERTVNVTSKKQSTVRPELRIEYCKNGKTGRIPALRLPEGELYLRITRLDGALKCWFTSDGRRWIMTQNLAIAFSDKAKVGLSASNASKEPLSARFEDFVMITEKDKVKEAEKN